MRKYMRLHRLMAMLLALVMVVGMLPAAAYAEGIESADEVPPPEPPKYEQKISAMKADESQAEDNNEESGTGPEKGISAAAAVWPFGSAGTELGPGRYLISVSLMQTANHNKLSVADSCIQGGEVEISENGEAYVRVYLNPFKVGENSQWAENWCIFSEDNTSSAKIPADIAAQDADGNVTAIGFGLADRSLDGVYCCMYVGLLGTSPEAYMKLGFKGAYPGSFTPSDPDAADKNAAAAVDEMIASIDPAGPEYGSRVAAARSAYEALSQNGKSYVKNYELLCRMEMTVADMAAAKAVDEKIAAIGKVSLESEPAVTAARSAFEALSETQKGYVEKLPLLTAAEDELYALKAALYTFGPENTVIRPGTYALDIRMMKADKPGKESMAAGAIKGGSITVMDNGDAYITVNLGSVSMMGLTAWATEWRIFSEYNITSSIVMADVIEKDEKGNDKTIRFKLPFRNENGVFCKMHVQAGFINMDPEALLLMDFAHYGSGGSYGPGQEELDAAAAKRVTDMISTIGSVTLESEQEIIAARSAYNALSDTQKALVKNLPVLEAAEARLEELKKDEKLDMAAAAAVDEKIAAIGKVSLESEKTINEARSAYNALSQKQKGMVTKLAELEKAEKTLGNLKAQQEADLAAAKEVEEKIAAIGKVSLQSESKISAARAAYEALSDVQKTLVKNLVVLDTAEAELQRLKDEAAQQDADKKAAAEVDKKIAAIGKVSLESEGKISAARAAYEALSESQKSLVEKLAVLDAAEAELHRLKEEAARVEADKKAAKAVDDKIAAIGEVSLAKEKNIKDARTAYELLTKEQKAYVEKLPVLTAAEAELQRLKDEAAQQDADRKAAAEADEKIAAIGNVTLASEAAIKDARLAYDKLSDTQKSLVKNLAALESAEKRLNELKEQQSQEELDKLTAAAVDEKISAIGNVTLASESTIKAARAAYDSLSPRQKALVTKLDTLKAAERRLDELKQAQFEADRKAAAAVDEKISVIGNVTLASETVIKDARLAYDKLSDTQKSYVKKLDSLEKAEAELNRLQIKDKMDREAAAAVDAKIAAIGNVSLNSEKAIGDARAAYDTLSEPQKGYVTKLDILTAAEARLEELKAAQAQKEKDMAAAKAVDEKIAAIGAVSLESEEKITAARAAYDNLTDAQKTYVTKLNILTAAEAGLNELKATEAQKEKDMAAAKAVDEKIAAIGAVSLESEEKITAARAAYGALSEGAKSYVTKLDVLTAAEEKLAALKAEEEQRQKDMAAARAVDEEIAAIGEVTLQSEKTIKDVRAAYEALNENAKSYVAKLDILTAAEARLEELKKVPSFEFGSAKTVIKPGRYSLPVSMMNSAHPDKPSMAASCILGGSLEVMEDGSAYVNIKLGPVTVGSITGWADEWAIYKEYNTNSETLPAQMVSTDAQGNVNEIRFKLPYHDKDGVFAVLAVKVIGMTPDAYLALDFKNAGSESEIKSYPVNFSASANGSIKAVVDGVEIKSGDKVDAGKKVIFTAAADEGYELDKWQGLEAAGTEASAVIKGELTVSVSFKKSGLSVYEGFSKGRNYDTYAEVSVMDGIITEVKLSHDAAEKYPASLDYAEKARTGMEPKFSGKSAGDKAAIEEIDAVSGATGTSNGFKKAVINALGLDKTPEFSFGSEKVKLEPGVYSVPVSLRHAYKHQDLSVAKDAFAPNAKLYVNEDGSAVLEAKMQPVSMGPIKDMAYNVKYFKEDNYTSQAYDVNVLESMVSPEGMTSAGKTVPTVISFTVPDNSFDGVYMSFTVDAMGGQSPEAWLRIDYARAGEPGGGGNTVKGSARVDQFGKYTIDAEVSLEEGIITGVKVSARDFISTTHIATNEAKIAQAAEGLKNVWNGMAPSAENAEAIFKAIMKKDAPDEVIDAVSGATYSAKAVRDAVMNAFGLEYEDEIINVPTELKPGIYEVEIGYYSDIVLHSLVENMKSRATLIVNADKSMSLDFDLRSGTAKEPLYILGFNGVYPDNDRSRALTLEGCSTIMGLSSNDYEDEYFEKGTKVVNHVTFPLLGGINKIYNTNCYLYVPVMNKLDGDLSGVHFEHGKFNVDVFAKIYWDSMRKIDDVPMPKPPVDNNDIHNLSDGSYIIKGTLLKTDRSSVSMANEGINNQILLTVSGGRYTLTLDFGPISFAGQKGYLGKLNYYLSGYAVGGGGKPIGAAAPAYVESVQRYTDGSVVKDEYGTDYPDRVSFEMIYEARDDGFVPLQVFVPLMDSVTPGSGWQDCYLKLDTSSVRPGNPGGGGNDNELPQEALDLTDEASGIKVHADRGVFNEKAELVVKEISSGKAYDEASELLKDVGTKFKLYDISFVNEKGEKLQPQGKVTVYYPVPDDFNEETLALYNLKDDGTKSLVKGEFREGFFVAVQKHFSLYALVDLSSATAGEKAEEEKPQAPAEEKVSEEPAETAEKSNSGTVWTVIIIAAAAIAVFFLIKKKKQQKVN